MSSNIQALPFTPSALLRHQSSLESILKFNVQDPVFQDDDSRQHAEELFALIVERLQGDEKLATPYRRVEMVRLIHHFSRTQQSKDLCLKAFFSFVDIGMAADPESIDFALLPEKLIGFTDYLFYNFFLPLKASSTKTPQQTPASLSVPALPANQTLPGTKARLATLRRDCLIRDKHCCVISRGFDAGEAVERIKRHHENAMDDEGNLLAGPPRTSLTWLEVAHILPHSLMDREGNAEMVKARENAVAILNMFDVGVCHLIEGLNIDRPTNAITLSLDLHRWFGSFRLYFSETDTEHTYTVNTTLPGIVNNPALPITRALFLSEHRTIDPPLARLFAIHAAVCQILHLSAAGYHCDEILRDTEEILVKADGSTNLGTLAALRLGGWWNGVVV